MPSADVLVFNISCFIAGLFLLEYGADKFVDHTAAVAQRLNVSPTLIGLLTCGAEWEEASTVPVLIFLHGHCVFRADRSNQLVVVIVALGQKNSDLALGNVIGSSIANILSSFSLGLLFIKKVEFDRSSKIYTAVLLAATSLFLVVLATLKLFPKWITGSLLIVLFVVYVGSVASLIYRGTLVAPESDSDSDSDSDGESDHVDNDSGSDIESDEGSNTNLSGSPSHSTEDVEGQGHQLHLLKPSNNDSRKRLRSPQRISCNPKPYKPLHYYLLRLVLGLAALLLSSYILAHSASTIGRELSLSSTVVGTTILSLATTLPEKFVAILGGVRHQPGILVANTVGSNIFLVTLCGGVLFLGGDADAIAKGFTTYEVMAMWLSAVAILGAVLIGGRRWMGGVLLGLYVAFLVAEFVTGRTLDLDRD
jgi:Ca2+/Na+ antiporter